MTEICTVEMLFLVAGTGSGLIRFSSRAELQVRMRQLHQAILDKIELESAELRKKQVPPTYRGASASHREEPRL